MKHAARQQRRNIIQLLLYAITLACLHLFSSVLATQALVPGALLAAAPSPHTQGHCKGRQRCGNSGASQFGGVVQPPSPDGATERQVKRLRTTYGIVFLSPLLPSCAKRLPLPSAAAATMPWLPPGLGAITVQLVSKYAFNSPCALLRLGPLVGMQRPSFPGWIVRVNWQGGGRQQNRTSWLKKKLMSRLGFENRSRAPHATIASLLPSCIGSSLLQAGAPEWKAAPYCTSPYLCKVGHAPRQCIVIQNDLGCVPPRTSKGPLVRDCASQVVPAARKSSQEGQPCAERQSTMRVGPEASHSARAAHLSRPSLIKKGMCAAQSAGSVPCRLQLAIRSCCMEGRWGASC